MMASYGWKMYQPQQPNRISYRWVHNGYNKTYVPPNALEAGRDIDGAPIYVARTNYQGDNIAVKYIPSKNAAYCSYNGGEVLVESFEILVFEPNFTWVHSSNGYIPPNAIPTGSTTSGETMYIGRGYHAGGLTVGKVHPSHGCLYIPFDGQEVSIRDYEVLVQN